MSSEIEWTKMGKDMEIDGRWIKLLSARPCSTCGYVLPIPNYSIRHCAAAIRLSNANAKTTNLPTMLSSACGNVSYVEAIHRIRILLLLILVILLILFYSGVASIIAFQVRSVV
jgi:hypothetical protein